MLDLPVRSTWGLFKKSPTSRSLTSRWAFLYWEVPLPRKFLRALCASTAEILFLQGVPIGAVLLMAMLLQPAVLLMGLMGVLAAVAFAAIVQLGNNHLERGPFLFNPMLAGLSVGYLFQPTAPALFLAAVAGVLAFVLTWVLSHLLRTFLVLPVLSLPFIVVSWVVHLAAFRYTGLQPAVLPAHTYTIGLPLYLEGFLRTLGLIFFLPNIWVGLVVAILLLVNSRIQFLLAISSYALGTTIRGILTGSFAYVYFDPTALNFILVALAIGGFYLLPSPRSYLLAGLGVALAAILGEAISVFWAAVNLPVHALPYNLVTLSLLYLLGLANHRLLARSPQATPERTLDDELTARLRYQGSGRTLALPFSGRWTVWQGIDGPWTHQGLWRYAFDFVIQDEQGQTYCGDGSQLSHYYAFQKPVLSPVRGWVVRVVQDLPDCPIGQVDSEQNWGNHIVLYDERGFYVEISHFAQNSIVVKLNDRVERGTLLGRCGNSGYSPQPHIHLQVQLTSDLGAATVPFSFTNLSVNEDYWPEAVPEAGSSVAPLLLDRLLSQTFNVPLETQFSFKCIQGNQRIGNLVLTLRMAIDGSLYLDSGRAKLYFSRNEDHLILHRLVGHDPWLALFLIAMPRLPLTRQPQQSWSDYLPIGLVTTHLRRALYQFGSSFYPALASARYHGQWQTNQELTGVISIPGRSRPLVTAVRLNAQGQVAQIWLKTPEGSTLELQESVEPCQLFVD